VSDTCPVTSTGSVSASLVKQRTSSQRLGRALSTVPAAFAVP
jgi:hypothetical protein